MNSFKIGNIEVPVPIIQGGMGIGISMSGLASAVADMGGIGVISSVGIGLVHNDPQSSYRKNNIDAIKNEIKKARKKTNGILGVNIMTVLTNFSDIVHASIEAGIDVIFSGAGLPLDLPKYVANKDTQTKLVPIVSSGRAASIICNKWKQNFDYLPDAVVVEGPKAGGHLGFKPDDLEHGNQTIQELVKEVLEVTKGIEEKYETNIPVIAAGGIFTGADIYEMMQIGVSAVQMGTRFVATKECDASQEFKNAFLHAKADDIKIIKSPVGLPARAIYNKFLKDAYDGKKKPEKCKFNCIKTCNPKTTAFCIADSLMAAYKGELENGFVFTGANAYRVDKITTVKDLFEELQKEYQATKNK